MENTSLIYENKVSLNDAVKNTLGGIGAFVSGLFQLNPKSAAVIGSGLILGLLAGIPVISWGSVLWALLFGAFTVFLYLQRSPQPAQYVDGVVLGAIAGTIGSFYPAHNFFSSERLVFDFRTFVERQPSRGGQTRG